MRALFVGCVEIGCQCLEECLISGCNVVGIFTLDERFARRTSGYRDFSDLARRYGIPLYRVANINAPEVVALIRSLEPDIIFVIGWQRLLGKEILAIPPRGCVGMHSSLLPKYRGRAPVNWAIINNEKETGITLFYLEEEPDAGNVIAQRGFPIEFTDTCKTVYEKAAAAGREMLREYLPMFEKGVVAGLPQDYRGVPLMPRRRPEDGIIDWRKSTLDLYNWVRALTAPYPGAFTFLNGHKVFLWSSRIPEVRDEARWGEAVPGEIIDVSGAEGILVRTGDGVLRLISVQIQGGVLLESQDIGRAGFFSPKRVFTDSSAPRLAEGAGRSGEVWGSPGRQP